MDRFKFPTANKSKGVIWQYVLKRNIRYHNGSALRNRDVKFTFDILKNTGGYYLNRKLDFSNIQSIEISGDLEVKFTLKQKDNFFDQKLTNIPVISQAYYNKLSENGFHIFGEIPPMGYGPFQFSRRRDESLVLTSNLNYIFGRSFLDKIFYRFFDDEQELIDSFLEGNVDLIEVQDYLTAEKLYQILKNEIRIFTSPRPEKKVYFILFNVNSFPFYDPRVRSAVRRGINRKEIISRIVSHNGHEAYSVIDYSNDAFYKELSKDVYQPILSMQTLNKRGWAINKTKGTLERDGRVLSFDLIYEGNSFLEENIARGVKINMAELGINVQPRPMSIFEKEKMIDKNKFSAVLMNYSYFENSIFDAVLDFYFDILNNVDGVPNYKNLNMEKLFKRADSHLEIQKEFLQQFQIIFHREAPVVFLFFDDKKELYYFARCW